MSVTSDANILAILKTWYTDEEFQSLLFRNDPGVQKFKQVRIGGKNYGISAMYGRGGAVAGDYTVAQAASGASGRNAEFLVTPGKIFSCFTLSQIAILAGGEGNGTKANYVLPLVNETFASTEALRKTLAATLYGSGFGELGVVGTYSASNALYSGGANGTLQVGSNIAYFSSDVQIKMDVGTVFRTTDTSSSALPSATLQSSVNTVTAMGSVLPGTNLYSVTFTATAANVWTATSWIELEGSRDGSGNALMPVGLGGWLPTFFNRTGSNWDTYIGTAFFGVTRNVATDRLAGNFYQRNIAGSEKYTDALLEAIRVCRRSGGEPDVILVNDVDFKQILSEVNGQTQYFQGADGKSVKPNITKGADTINFAFSTNWVEKIIDSPYVPIGKAYILDSKVIEFAGISNTAVPFDGGAGNNEPGRPDVTSVKAAPTMFQLIVDDWINVKPSAGTTDGPGVQVDFTVYGSFVVRNPASCAVVKFL